ncbi:MAG: HAD-IIIA family hydrolase [Proteobacteria bacterium]|nr:HAD-IIIA family hydrolase [Pseudomonadota bacterium]
MPSSGSTASSKAVFLDRDGVLVEDAGSPWPNRDLRLLPGAARALAKLKAAGYRLVVVSNQTLVARGLLDEVGVTRRQARLERTIRACGGPELDGFYFCPHHPAASIPSYRRDCNCRKPAPGLLERAAQELGIDCRRSVMVGDRPSDVVAGRRMGCHTIQVQTGRHNDPLIEVTGGFCAVDPNHVCKDLAQAATLILEMQP